MLAGVHRGLDWFKGIPEGLQSGILTFMDSQVPRMAALQMPPFLHKPSKPLEQESQPTGSASAEA